MKKPNSPDILTNPGQDFAEFACSDRILFLSGESSKCKELIAEALHDFGLRASKEFLRLDLGNASLALPPTITTNNFFVGLPNLEAFIDKGLALSVKGGTVFITNVNYLRINDFIQFLSEVEKKFQSRLIIDLAVGNRNSSVLKEFYRSSSTIQHLHIVPLKKHADNIRFFANYFLAKQNLITGRNIIGVSAQVLSSFETYSWPDNYVELRNMIKFSSCVQNENNMPLELASMPERIVEQNSQYNLKNTLLQAEVELIFRTLQQTGNNTRRAAEILRISRKSLYLKLRNYAHFINPKKQGFDLSN